MEQKCSLGEGSWFPSRDIHNSIFELFYRCWKPHQVGEGNCILPTSTVLDPKPVGTRQLMMLTHFSATTSQKNVLELIRPLWIVTIRLLLPTQVWTHSFEGISPLLLLPGKARKLSFSTSKKKKKKERKKERKEKKEKENVPTGGCSGSSTYFPPLLLKHVSICYTMNKNCFVTIKRSLFL